MYVGTNEVLPEQDDIEMQRTNQFRQRKSKHHPECTVHEEDVPLDEGNGINPFLILLAVVLVTLVMGALLLFVQSGKPHYSQRPFDLTRERHAELRGGSLLIF